MRQPAAVLGLRPVRGHVAADPDAAAQGVGGELPPFVDPRTSRDFVHVDDVIAAFVRTATSMQPNLRRELQHRHRQEDHHRASSPRRRDASSSSTPNRSSAPWKAGPGTWRTGTPIRARPIAQLGWQPVIELDDGLRSHRRVGQDADRRRARRGDQEGPECDPAQRDRRRRLLQGRPGHPDHVRAPDGHLPQARHRLRDHLRQRLQPRRQRGGHPGPQRKRPPRDRHLAFAQLRLADGVPQRDGAGHQGRRACCSTATCRIRPS